VPLIDQPSMKVPRKLLVVSAVAQEDPTRVG
jgi:hypothetical protein